MLKNIISSFFARGGIAVLNLLILLISTRQLGSGVVGQISLLIVNIAIVQIINEIYTGYSLVYYIPKSSLGRLYKTGLGWVLASTLLLNLFLLLLSTIRDSWLPATGHADSGRPDMWLHGLLLSLAITLHSFHCVILLAKEKISAYNWLMLCPPTITLLVLSLQIFLLQNRTAQSYITALYVSYFVSALLSFCFMPRLLKSGSLPGAAFSLAAILRNGFINQLGNLAHTLSNRYNYYLIGAAALLGVYASATSLIESIWIIGGSIAPMMLSRVANTHNAKTNIRLTLLLSKLSFLLSLFCVGIILLLPESFFTFLLGKDFSNTKQIMLHLAPGVLCISFSTVISHFFSGQGIQKVQLLANSLGLLVTICSSYYLIMRYQIIGACYAASLSYFTASLVLVTVFMKQNDFRLKDLFSIRRDLELLRK